MGKDTPGNNEKSGQRMVQANVLYPKQLLRRAEAAWTWEGMKKAEYFRTALLARIRKTEAEKERSGGEAK